MHGERRSVEGREYQNERDLTDVDDFKSGKIWSAFLDKLLVCSAKGNSTASPRNLKLNCCRRSLQSKFDLSNQLIRRLYTAVIATAMEHICTRCARLSLRTRYQSPSMVRMANSKTFSTSSIARNDKDDGNEPTPHPLVPHFLTHICPLEARSPSTQARPRMGSKNLNQTQGAPRIRREPSSAPTAQPLRARGPQTLQRKQPQPGQFQGQRQAQTPGAPPTVLRRIGAGTGRLPSGQIQGGRFRRDPKAGGPDRGQGGKPQTDRRMALARGKAKEDKESEQDAEFEDIELQADDYVAKCVDRPVNPTEPIEHVPGENMTIEELRKDWPNIPLSTTGLTESVQQRIESLAHRLPHGYQTPMQLVERYRKGKLTRFESEEEKETVLKLAAEVSQQKADQITEKKGTEVQAKDMAFDDLSSRSGERNALTDAYVKGTYPTLEKQKMPFLDQITRNLRNNDTYNAMQSEEFMKAIASMTGSQSQQQGGQQQQRRK
jgi:hypothetical protein